MICAQQITVNTVCAWWAKMISAKTQGGLPSADHRMKQNQAPTQALAALALFRTNRQSFGLALIWPGCRSYAVDCFWICESSEVSTTPPGSLAVCNPTANLDSALPIGMVSRWDSRASNSDLHQVLGRSQSGCSATFSGSAELELMMGCSLREEAHRLGALSLLTPRRCRCWLPRFACHPKPIPWSFLALDRPAHKGCSGPSSWAEACQSRLISSQVPE